MKRIYLFFLLSLSVLIMSNAVGPGLVQNADRTGSPVSAGTCNLCHNGGSFNPTTSIQLLQDNQPVDSYVPGETYTVRLLIDADNSPSAYGFQMTALNDNDANAGTFQNEPNGTRLINVSGRRYFEHSMRLTNNSVDVEWIAPEAGSGDASFYAAGLAVNGNGGTTGDIASTASLTITEMSGSASVAIENGEKLRLFPNPAHDVLFIDGSEDEIQSISILDLSGRAYQVNRTDLTVDISALPAGIYTALIKTEKEVASKPFLKQ